MQAIFNNSLAALPDKVLCYAMNFCTAESAAVVYSIFETSVIRQTCTDPQYANHFYTFQSVFGIGNIAWILWNWIQFASCAEAMGSTSFLSKLVNKVLIIAAVPLLSYTGVKLINRHYKSEESAKGLLNTIESIPEERRPYISLSWHRPAARELWQFILLERILLNASLACLTPNHFQYLACALSEAHSLLKISQIKWLNFSKMVDLTDPNPAKAIFSYRILWLQSKIGSGADDCSICLDPNPNTFFCTTHAFHEMCLLESLASKDFRAESWYRTNYYTAFRGSQPIDHSYTHSTYKVIVPEKNLPTCPLCRGQGVQSYVKAEVEDKTKGRLPTTVEIKKDGNGSNSSFFSLPVFDKLAVVYTAFQAVLSQIQRSYPEKAESILKIQRFSLAADIALVIRNCVLLHNTISKRWEKVDPKTWYKKHAYKIIAIGTVLGVAAIGLSVFFINHFFKPSIDPQSVLKNILSPNEFNELGSIICKWEIPFLQQATQAILISRVMSELVLAYFTSHRIFHSTLAAMQIFTLFNITQLRWINFERME